MFKEGKLYTKLWKSHENGLKQTHPVKLGLIPLLFGKQNTISCIDIKGKLMTLKQTFSV